jgi:hypothetical protein
MITLAQAFANLPAEEQQDLVNGYFGNKLFEAIGQSSDDPAEVATKLANVKALRDSPLLKAMASNKQVEILELCDDAENLLSTPDE